MSLITKPVIVLLIASALFGRSVVALGAGSRGMVLSGMCDTQSVQTIKQSIFRPDIIFKLRLPVVHG